MGWIKTSEKLPPFNAIVAVKWQNPNKNESRAFLAVDGKGNPCWHSMYKRRYKLATFKEWAFY